MGKSITYFLSNTEVTLKKAQRGNHVSHWWYIRAICGFQRDTGRFL